MLGNPIDLVILLILGFCYVKGRRRGVFDALTDLIGIVLAIAIALMAYRYASDLLVRWIALKPAYLDIISFFLIAALAKRLALCVADNLTAKPRPRTEPLHDIPDISITSGIISLSYGALALAVFAAVLFSLPMPSSVSIPLTSSASGHYLKNDPAGLNREFRKLFTPFYEAALDDFEFLRIQTGDNRRIELGFTTTETMASEQDEENMLDLINTERATRGLKPLAMYEPARLVARDYGRYLFANGFLSHYDLEKRGSGERLRHYKIPYMLSGENLAYAHDVIEAHSGLMQSPDHRDNILQPLFTRVGIGAIDAGRHGKIYVQEFLD